MPPAGAPAHIRTVRAHASTTTACVLQRAHAHQPVSCSTPRPTLKQRAPRPMPAQRVCCSALRPAPARPVYYSMRRACQHSKYAVVCAGWSQHSMCHAARLGALAKLCAPIVAQRMISAPGRATGNTRCWLLPVHVTPRLQANQGVPALHVSVRRQEPAQPVSCSVPRPMQAHHGPAACPCTCQHRLCPAARSVPGQHSARPAQKLGACQHSRFFQSA